ncbi:MAG: 4-(cytidine 5'-diphospho)-2-C-methyl-D-erythritol kinase [Geminicoccaceae bacterium]
MAEPLTRPARAKVNLDLLVTARRPDGYHELDSLVVFAGAADTVTVAAAADLSLEVKGRYAGDVPPGEGNHVLGAARALAAAVGCAPRARLTLVKDLPVASGIGGGSSDAAATLHALCRLWGLEMPAERLRDIGLTIGADLPVCLYGAAVRMRGIGERLDPVRGLPDLPLLLVNPGVAVPTGPVFRALRLADEPKPRAVLPPHPSLGELAAWLAASRNDLQAPAVSIAPVIGTLLDELQALPDCLVARMSGSGATCWALFPDARRLAAAHATLVAAHPAWWSWAGVVPAGA